MYVCFLSFPLVGNLSSRKDAGQAGMTKCAQFKKYAQIYMTLCIDGIRRKSRQKDKNPFLTKVVQLTGKKK